MKFYPKKKPLLPFMTLEEWVEVRAEQRRLAEKIRVIDARIEKINQNYSYSGVISKIQELDKVRAHEFNLN